MDHLLINLIGIAFAIASLVLLSLGLAIIYGMMGIINLAQGEFIMLGARRTVSASGSASRWRRWSSAPSDSWSSAA
jgi:urea transport system permease protein